MSRVDDRLAVVAFDGRPTPDAVLFGGALLPHRSGFNLQFLAAQMHRGGAAAVIFVGFDGSTLRDGPIDRNVIAASSAIQDVTIAPLLDVVLERRRDGIPRGVRYRVDELAAEFAGIGLPVISAEPTLRSVPMVARVSDLRPGAVVPGSPSSPERESRLVVGLPLRGLQALEQGEVRPSGGAGVSVGRRSVPLEDGSLRVRWADSLQRTPNAIIAPERVLADEVDQGLWKGKIVLVGTIDPAYATTLATPHGRQPELLVHANALNTLLTEEYLRAVPSWHAVLVALLAAAAIVLSWRRHPLLAAAASLFLAVGWLWAASELAERGRLIDPLRPALASILTLAGLGAAAAVLQLLERRHLAKLFGEYVPQDVARELISTGRSEIAQAGQRLFVTVLFCDLRGFTPLAARLNPAEVRALLDIYYEICSKVVFDHGGTVLQYTGDEIFAVFGAPLPSDRHADTALACAGEMRSARTRVNAALVAVGLPEIAFGIGLHSGQVVAAHVGSSIRRQYAIIGDPVNVGSRLCGQARRDEIVYSREVHEQLTSPPVAQLDAAVALKGLAGPVAVYRHHLGGE